LSGLSGQAVGQSGLETGVAQNLFSQGAPSITSGTNFLNTILNGNRANTTALLQPSINQIQQGTQGNLQAINTLMPRGGGRSAANYGASFAPQAQIQSLFNPMRTTAATALPQIGLAQQGLGANLFSTANQPLSTAAGASSNLANVATQQQQMSNQLMGGIGNLIMGAALAPLGGTALGGLFGK